MNQARAIVAIGWADFLERVRRYRFLLTLLFAFFLGYAASTGRISLQLGEFRGVYTSAWIGALIAVTTTSFVSLVGFYIVKSAIDRDRQTGVGQILAATPLSKASYTLGKFLSNFAVLASMVVVLAICALLMQFFAAEDPHLNIAALVLPFLLVALPAMMLTAATAVLFETLPILRGGIGNIVWFLVWAMLGIGLPEISGNHKLDPMGLMTIADDMMAGARTHIPGYKDGFAFTVADQPVKVVQAFRWQGVSWTTEQVLMRVLWAGVAIALVLLAALVFDRFDASRSLAPSLRSKPKDLEHRLDALPTPVPAGALRAILRSASAHHLTPLAARTQSGTLGRLFAAELRLALNGQRWWWYAVAFGLLIAQCVAPFDVARGPLLGTAWIWPVLVWSGMGARETRFGTRAILFSSARILSRQLPACWLAGIAVAVLAGAGAGVRLFLVQGFHGVLPWLAGAIFLPSLALALGVWSGVGKPFEGLLTALWYIGPMNHTKGIDFTGAANGALMLHYVSLYLALSAGLVVAAFFVRARQLRSI